MSIDDVMITNGGSTNPGCALSTNFAQVAASCPQWIWTGQALETVPSWNTGQQVSPPEPG